MKRTSSRKKECYFILAAYPMDKSEVKAPYYLYSDIMILESALKTPKSDFSALGFFVKDFLKIYYH